MRTADTERLGMSPDLAKAVARGIDAANHVDTFINRGRKPYYGFFRMINWRNVIPMAEGASIIPVASISLPMPRSASTSEQPIINIWQTGIPINPLTESLRTVGRQETDMALENERLARVLEVNSGPNLSFTEALRPILTESLAYKLQLFTGQQDPDINRRVAEAFLDPNSKVLKYPNLTSHRRITYVTEPPYGSQLALNHSTTS